MNIAREHPDIVGNVTLLLSLLLLIVSFHWLHGIGIVFSLCVCMHVCVNACVSVLAYMCVSATFNASIVNTEKIMLIEPLQ